MTRKTIWNFITHGFTKNITAKVMALAMAMTLWVYAHSFSYVRSSPQPVPLNILTSEGWAVADGHDSSVRVVLSYPRRFERQVEQAIGKAQVGVEVTITPDESGTDIQTFNRALTEANLNVPPGLLNVRADEFEPSQITVQLTREIARILPVEVKLSSLPHGYERQSVRVDPEGVTVRGRKDILTQATFIETEDIVLTVPSVSTLDLTAVSARLKNYVEVHGIQYPVHVEKDTVQCQIMLVQTPREKTFSAVPIHIMEPPDYPYEAIYRAEKTTKVTVLGPAGLMDAIGPDSITLYVDVSELKPSPTDLPYSQPIQWNIMPQSADFTVKLGTPNCGITIRERL